MKELIKFNFQSNRLLQRRRTKVACNLDSSKLDHSSYIFLRETSRVPAFRSDRLVKEAERMLWFCWVIYFEWNYRNYSKEQTDLKSDESQRDRWNARLWSRSKRELERRFWVCMGFESELLMNLRIRSQSAYRLQSWRADKAASWSQLSCLFCLVGSCWRPKLLRRKI